MTHPLIEALKEDHSEGKCPNCSHGVFRVALEPQEYQVDLELEDVKDLRPSAGLGIQAVECNNCGQAL